MLLFGFQLVYDELQRLDKFELVEHMIVCKWENEIIVGKLYFQKLL
jgi:hypothetical protein